MRRDAIRNTKHMAVVLTKQQGMSKELPMKKHPSRERPQKAIVSIQIFSKHHRRPLANAAGQTRLDCTYLYSEARKAMRTRSMINGVTDIC